MFSRNNRKKPYIATAVSLALGTAFIISANVASAGDSAFPHYKIEAIDANMLAGRGRGIVAINDNGYVISWWSNSDSRVPQVWNSATGVRGVSDGVTFNIPYDINNNNIFSSQSASNSGNPKQATSFQLTPTSTSYNGTIVYDYTSGMLDDYYAYTGVASGINDNNQAAGHTRLRKRNASGIWVFKDRAFYHFPYSAVLYPETLGGTNSAFSSINNNNISVGYAQTASAAKHAVSYSLSTGTVDLGTLGGVDSWALDINDSNQIVGWSVTSSGQTSPFIHDGITGMVELTSLNGAGGTATDINNDGFIIGSSNNQPVLWVNGDVTNLNTRISSSASAWTLQTVADINNNGQIIGEGLLNGVSKYFILTPNNAPVANAGADQVIEATGGITQVTLDGSASNDPDGDTLTYSWSGAFGTSSEVSPTIGFSLGTSVNTLTVDDGFQATGTDTASITVQVTQPITVTYFIDEMLSDGRITNRGISKPITDKLTNAQADVDAGDNAGAIQLLHETHNMIDGVSGSGIDPVSAEELHDYIAGIVLLLSAI